MQPLRKSLEEITADRIRIKKDIFDFKKEIIQIKFSKNFKLSEKDQKDYDSWNKMVEENKKGEVSIFKPYANEKDYVIKGKRSQIKLLEHYLVKLICEGKGHKESVRSIGTSGAYVNCTRCGTAYTRSMNVEESNRFAESMNTPITI